MQNLHDQALWRPNVSVQSGAICIIPTYKHKKRQNVVIVTNVTGKKSALMKMLM